MKGVRSGNMHDDSREILITKEEIDQKCAEIGQQLTKEYEGKFPLAIGVLKGAVPFMADVLRYTETHLEIDFMDVSSYGSGTQSSGEVKIVKDLDTKVDRKSVV